MAVTIAIDPLANPKGLERLCELCQKPAYNQCAHCRVTFYCGADHQKVDWLGIHEKICQLLIPLRTLMPFFSSEEERVHRKQQLIQRQGKYDQAVPAAMQSLRFTVELFGLASVELVRSYLMLSEASIGMNKLKQAEEYLCQAEWTVLKTPDCPNTIKHKLCRNLGLLHVAKGDFESAQRDFATDIYYASEEYGTQAIETSGGYFHMANIFHRQGDIAKASSLYEEVTNIWHEYLLMLVRARLESPKAKSGLVSLAGDVDEKENDLDEAQQAEAVNVLNAIFEVRDRDTAHGENTTEHVAKIAHATAMLCYLLHDIDKAKEYGRRAVGASAGMHDEDFSRSIVDFLKICENVKVVME